MEQTRHLWYVKREGRQAGPFPEAAIAEDSLLGRLPASAEISGDGVTWNPLSAVTRPDSGTAPRSAQPPYWGDVPPNWADVPPNGSDVSSYWGDVPPNWADVPPNGSDVSSYWADVPPNGSDVSSYWGDVPPNWADVPPNGSDVSSYWADVPPNGADVPENWISERDDARRRWADQRSGRDRRTAERGIAHPPRRRGDERRTHPTMATRHPAAVRTPPSASSRSAQRWLMVAGVLAAVMLAATGARYGPVNPITVDLGVAARPAQ